MSSVEDAMSGDAEQTETLTEDLSADGLPPVDAAEGVAEEVFEERPDGALEEAPEAAPEGGAMDRLPALTSVIEAILFAVDRPVTTEELRRAVPESDKEALLTALDSLEEKYRAEDSGVGLQEVAGGYLLSTRPELGIYVERFLIGKRRSRLSRAALETLATIAYRQPITRGEVEELRGVDSGHVIHTLMTRDLITVKGRSEMLGRPLLYATTTEFMRYFGLQSISDLPNLEEMAALTTSDPLEDPEIREALETSGLLEDLQDESEESHGTEVESEREGETAEDTDGDTLSIEASVVDDEEDEVRNVEASENRAESDNETPGNSNGDGTPNGNGRPGEDGEVRTNVASIESDSEAELELGSSESEESEIAAGGEVLEDDESPDADEAVSEDESTSR